MVTISVNVKEFRKLVNKGKLGEAEAGGRMIEGRKIASFVFTRGNLVDYVMEDGKEGPLFQDVMYLND